MKKEHFKISPNDYKHLQSHPELLENYCLNEAAISNFPPEGYGFFNPELEEKDGDHYVTWFHYESCD